MSVYAGWEGVEGAFLTYAVKVYMKELGGVYTEATVVACFSRLSQLFHHGKAVFRRLGRLSRLN
jgi:hypothetical protein